MRRLILQIIFVLSGLLCAKLVAVKCPFAELGGPVSRRALRATSIHDYDIPRYTLEDLQGTGFPASALPLLNQLVDDYHQALDSHDSTRIVNAAVKIFQTHKALTMQVVGLVGEGSKQTGSAARLEFTRLHQLSHVLTAFPPESVKHITTEVAKLKVIAAARCMPHMGMTIKVVPKRDRNVILILPDMTTELGKLASEAYGNSVFIVFDPMTAGTGGAMFHHHSRQLLVSGEAVLTGKIDPQTEHEVDHYSISMLEENGTPSPLHGEAEIHPDRARPGEMLPTDPRKSVQVDVYGDFVSLQELYTHPKELKNGGPDAQLLPTRATAAHDIGARFYRIGSDLLPRVAEVDRNFQGGATERGRFSHIPEILPDGDRLDVPAIGSYRSWSDGTPHTMVGFRITTTYKNIPYVEALIYDGPTLLRLKWFGTDVVDHARDFGQAVAAQDGQIRTRASYLALKKRLEDHLQWISQTGAQVREETGRVLVTSDRFSTTKTAVDRQAVTNSLDALTVPAIQR